jgi:hypothetical protein
VPDRLRRARSVAVRGVKRLGRPVKRQLHRWVGTRSGPAAVAPGERIHRLALTAESVEWLECYATTAAAGSRIHQLELTVRRWRRPQADWSGRLGPLPDLVSWAVTLPPSGNGPARLRLRVGRAVPLPDALRAAVSALRPDRPLLYPAAADLTVAGPGISWLAGTPARTRPTPLPPNPVIRGYDTVLAETGTDPGTSAADAGHVALAHPVGLELRERSPWPMLNLALAHPYERGRKSGPALGAGLLELAPDGWRVRLGRDIVAHGPCDGRPFAPGTRAALRRVGVVTGSGLAAVEPGPLALLLVHLAGTGVVLDLPDLPAAAADRLGGQLRAVLAEPHPAAGADPIEWEIRSARQRTAAIREHAPGFVLRAVSDPFPTLRRPPSVSALLVTHRPDYVDRVLAMLERQSYPELEVVLCLHGAEPPPELRERAAGSDLPVELVAADRDLCFGEVLGQATARARGSLVTKLDDDDWYGPEHIWDLVVARAYSRATMVGKAAEFVHVEPLDATIRRETMAPEVYGDPVAGGTMLIGRGELEELGGWRPVPRSVDRGMLDRLLRAGGTIYRTHPFGYLYERRASGHTWNVDLEYLLRGVKTQWPGRLRHPEFGTAEPQAAR